jgi:hypothetical protein
MKKILLVFVLAAGCGGAQQADVPKDNDPLLPWRQECDNLLAIYDKAKVCMRISLETREDFQSRADDVRAKLGAQDIDAANEESKIQVSQQCRDFANTARKELEPSGC